MNDILVIQYFTCRRCERTYRLISLYNTDKEKRLLEEQELCCPRCERKMKSRMEKISGNLFDLRNRRSSGDILIGDAYCAIRCDVNSITIFVRDLMNAGFHGSVSIVDGSDDLASVAILPIERKVTVFKKEE